MIFALMHVLTAVLVVLKLTGLIAVSWLIVFSPTIVAFAIALILTLAAVAFGAAILTRRR